jgi:hypothetical protein
MHVPASGELSTSELNPYVVGGLAVGHDGYAEVGVERVQEPFPRARAVEVLPPAGWRCFPADSSSQVSVVCVCVRYVKMLYGFDVAYVAPFCYRSARMVTTWRESDRFIHAYDTRTSVLVNQSIIISPAQLLS